MENLQNIPDEFVSIMEEVEKTAKSIWNEKADGYNQWEDLCNDERATAMNEVLQECISFLYEPEFWKI